MAAHRVTNTDHWPEMATQAKDIERAHRVNMSQYEETRSAGLRKLPADTEDIMAHQDNKEVAHQQGQEGSIESRPEGLAERVVRVGHDRSLQSEDQLNVIR